MALTKTVTGAVTIVISGKVVQAEKKDKQDKQDKQDEQDEQLDEELRIAKVEQASILLAQFKAAQDNRNQ